MGLIIYLIKKILKLLLYLTLFISIVLLIPNLPPYTKFTSIEVEETLPRTGALAPNSLLNNVEKLYEGKLLGPEVFEVHNGEIYTGLATGEIVKVSTGGHVTFVAKIGQPCTGLVQEHICGRPLGLQIDKKNNQLYVADAYYGIWKIDLKTNNKILLVSPNVPIDGRLPKFFNDIAVDDNGDLYWTGSTSDFDLKNGLFVMLMDPSGRVFYYNAAKNSSTVLLDNVGLPNGVVMSLDKQFILVAESNKFRILKYFINGPNKGKSEVFIAGLPGVPDSVRVLPDGSGILVALYVSFDDEHPLLTKDLLSLPLIRKFIMRVALLIDYGFEFLNSQFPHPIFESIAYNVGHFKSGSKLTPEITGLVQIDWNGNIVSSYFNTDQSIHHISDAIVYNDKLYTGCPHEQNFIGSLPAPAQLKKAFTVPKHSSEAKTKEETVAREHVKENLKEKKVDSKVAKPTLIKPQPIEQKQKPPVKETVAENKPIQEEKKGINEPKFESKNVPKQNVAEDKHKKKDTVAPKIKENDTKQNPKAAETKPQVKKTENKAKTQQPEKLKETVPKNSKAPSGTEGKPLREGSSVSEENKPLKIVSTGTDENKPKSALSGGEEKPTKNVASGTEGKKPASGKEEKKTKKPIDKHIPVVENIPSDTSKPYKEKLKVIKKSGPDVIPNPNL